MHALDPPTIVSLQPEGCVAADRGIMLAIHRAPIQGARVAEVRTAIAKVSAGWARDLIGLTVFRLSPEFPIGVGVDSNVRELAGLLRTIDRSLVAHATVLEFEGVLAAVMRVAMRTVISLARPRCAMAESTRMSDAIAWLRPHAVRVGAPDDPATFLRLYREVDRQLADFDARRHGEAPASALAR